MTVFDWGRIIDVVAEHCMTEDRVDRCSSKIMYSNEELLKTRVL